MLVSIVTRTQEHPHLNSSYSGLEASLGLNKVFVGYMCFVYDTLPAFRENGNESAQALGELDGAVPSTNPENTSVVPASVGGAHSPLRLPPTGLTGPGCPAPLPGGPSPRAVGPGWAVNWGHADFHQGSPSQDASGRVCVDGSFT